MALALYRTKRPSAARAKTTMSTQLLADVFALCDPDAAPVHVLDFGSGTGATVNFLTTYRAKVYFADMLDQPLDIAVTEDASVLQTQELLAAQLALPEGVQFDVVLFWDFLHMLDITQLEALSSILYPHLHRNTRGYGFGTLRPSEQLQPSRFSIAALDQLEISPVAGAEPFVAHSQQRLNEHFFAMQVARATLLQEGRLELLFTLP